MSNLTITLEGLLSDENIDLSNKDLDKILNRMLDEIGNPDPYLRDYCIYPTFIKLIRENALTLEQETHLLERCLDNHHLFLEIEKEGCFDYVFTRSFSALVIADILHKDGKQCEIEASLIKKAIKASIQYLSQEKDHRGYVAEKGWAHSVAHGSDLLTNAIFHPLFNKQYMNDCLQAVKACLLVETAYIDEEDERILNIIGAFIQKGLDDKALLFWLESLPGGYSGTEHAKYRIHWNVKKFANTLFIYLERNRDFSQSKQWILRLYERSFI